MRNSLLIVICLILAVLLITLWHPNQAALAQPAPAQSLIQGRFEILSPEGVRNPIFKIDTATGQAWIYKGGCSNQAAQRESDCWVSMPDR
jgi:hypothetical protein